MAYFSFQGKVYIGQKRADGHPKELFFVGNSPEVVVTFETETIDHKESTSCSRLTDFQLETEQRVSLRVVLEELLPINLQIALRSTAVAITGSTVTNEQIGPDSGLVVTGSTVYGRTKFADISSITLTDSAAPTPNALVANTDYAVESADYGLIRWITVTGDTQPYLIDYTYAAQTANPFFNLAQQNYYIVVDACNTAQSGAKYRLELYSIQLQPTNELALINDEIGQFVIEGAALYDASLGTDPNFGNFGRLITIT